MVDLVWMVTMASCMVFFLAMALYFHKKNQEELAAEEEERKKKHAAAVAAVVGKSEGKQLHLSTDEIQRDLDRLCMLFSHTTEPARKREAAKPPQEVPESPLTAPKAVPKPPPAAPKEIPKPTPAAPEGALKPSAEIRQKTVETPNPPTGYSRAERRARAEGHKGSEHIKSEIEQAVKETQ